MNMIDVFKSFDTDEKCLAFLEKMRWPEGVRCVTCGCDRISRITRSKPTKNVRGNLYQCLEKSCKQQFTSTSGTIFHDSHLSLTKWFLATALIVNAKKGLSALQLGRDLGIVPPGNKVKKGRKTAWYLAHRIREAMAETEEEKAEILTGTIEVDETYIGGKYDKRRKRAKYDKPAVMGILERKGKVRATHIPEVTKAILIPAVLANTIEDSTIYTDELPAYKSLKTERIHDAVCHSAKEWVRGDVHTNGIEGFWSLFNRGVIGQFHKVSVKHLQKYMDETQYKFNRRDDEELFVHTLARMCGTAPLPYKKLTAN
jgi:transposase-like protein